MKKVIVFGTFDVIHKGHVHMLKEAKQYGDYLVIIVARDATVCEVKGSLPRDNEQLRLRRVEKLGIGDKIRLGSVDDKYQVLNEENPDIIALGYDQHVFVDNLEEAIDDHVQIVRLSPYMPKIYKSSRIKAKKRTAK